MKTGTFKNGAGDIVILDYDTATSRAYEEAGYKLVENSDEVTASARTAAEVLTSEPQVDGVDTDKVHYKDDQDVPADPSAVAYPAGQLPRESVVPANHDMEPISDRTMQDSQPDGTKGTVPLVDAYDTPPTEGRNPTPEQREQMRIANAEAGIVDERGVHEHQDGESTTGGAAVAGSPTTDTPDDLKASSVVQKSQGANEGTKSQGTVRPTASARKKS